MSRRDRAFPHGVYLCSIPRLMARPGDAAHDSRERESEVRELRAVLLSVPPLLADLISRVATSRLEQYGIRLSILAEIADVASVGARLAELAPDLAIVGYAAISRLPTEITASLVCRCCLRICRTSPARDRMTWRH
jgi:hypothetical protein